MTAKGLVSSVLGAAQKASNAAERSHVLRNGAAQFARLALDPRNVKQKGQLTAIGLELAGAAMKLESPGMHHDPSVQARDLHAIHALYPEGLDEAIETGEAPSHSTPPRVSVQPASISQETALGRYATVKFAPTSDDQARGVVQQQTVALWPGNKVESQAMSIDVGTVIVPVPPPTKGVLGRPFARIQYGADGNIQNQVDIDVGLGKRITVVGNYISVIVGMDPVPAGIVSAEMTIGASIGMFAAPTAAPVFRTVYADGLVPGASFAASALFNIPLRATRLFPPLLLVDDTITITFLNIVGIPISVWTCTYSPTTRFQVPEPVPADAFFITVQITNAPNASVRVPFELSL